MLWGVIFPQNYKIPPPASTFQHRRFGDEIQLIEIRLHVLIESLLQKHYTKTDCTKFISEEEDI